MIKRMKRWMFVAVTATVLALSVQTSASAQYPVVVAPTYSAVVGDTAEPAGLFGLRTRYRPVVAPVAPVSCVQPVYPAPVVEYRAPVVQTFYAPAPVAIHGKASDSAADRRERGLMRALSPQDDVTLHQSFHATNWSRQEGSMFTRVALRRYPHASVIWSANDDVLLGLLEAARRSGMSPGQDLVTGGIDGTIEVIEKAARGEQATFASDIYSLGCVAYWLLTGRHVFDAKSVMAMLLKHVSEEPRPPSELRPDLPNELNELVLGCLAKNPADRPGDALELGERLASIPLAEPWDNRRARAWWNESFRAGGLSEAFAETPLAAHSEITSMTKPGHPTEAILMQWVRGQLGENRAEAVERHLEECDACAASLGQLDESDDEDPFVSRVREILE